MLSRCRSNLLRKLARPLDSINHEDALGLGIERNVGDIRFYRFLGLADETNDMLLLTV